MRVRMVVTMLTLGAMVAGAGGAGALAAEGDAPLDAPFYSDVLDDEGIHHFIIGRLSSRAFEVLTMRGGTYGSGPVDGKVLGYWTDERGRSGMALFDTRDGSSRQLLEHDGGLIAMLSPDGRTAYWITMGENRVDGVFRRSVDGGEIEHVADGWPGLAYQVAWSVNGETLVIAGMPPQFTEWRYEYRILDVSDGHITGPLEFRGGYAIGLHAGNLIAYYITDDGIPELVSVEVSSGKVTDLVDRPNEFAAIVRSEDGPTLVIDGVREGRYALWRIGLDGSDRQMLWDSDSPWDEPAMRMVRSTMWYGVESPGWVLLSPDQMPYPGLVDVAPRRQLSVDDGSTVRLPTRLPEREVAR